MYLKFNLKREYFSKRMQTPHYRRIVFICLFLTLLLPFLTLQRLDDFVEAMQPKHVMTASGVVDEAFKYVEDNFKVDTYGLKIVIDKKVYHIPEYVLSEKLDIALKELQELRGENIRFSYMFEYGDNYILALENEGRIYVEPTNALREYRWNSGSYIVFGLVWLIAGTCLTAYAAGIIEIKRSKGR